MVTLGSLKQIEIRLLGGAGRRRGNAFAADVLHPLHAATRLLQSLLATCLVIHDPLKEVDGTLHLQTPVLNAPTQLLQIAALLHIAIQFIDPGLDALIARFGSDLDQLDHIQLLAHQRAGVQAVTEGFLSLALGRCCPCDSAAGRRQHRSSFDIR